MCFNVKLVVNCSFDKCFSGVLTWRFAANTLSVSFNWFNDISCVKIVVFFVVVFSDDFCHLDEFCFLTTTWQYAETNKQKKQMKIRKSNLNLSVRNSQCVRNTWWFGAHSKNGIKWTHFKLHFNNFDHLNTLVMPWVLQIVKCIEVVAQRVLKRLRFTLGLKCTRHYFMSPAYSECAFN